MELNEFIKNFAEQFDDTDISEFKAETAFKDLDEWSSYLALSIMAMVEDNYEVELTAADFNGANTISDLFNIVKSKQ